MINLRPGSRLKAGATFCEVQTNAGSLCLKEPDHDGDYHDGDYDGDHEQTMDWAGLRCKTTSQVSSVLLMVI